MVFRHPAGRASDPAVQGGPRARAGPRRRLADAYLSLSIITFFYDWDWRGAERTFIRSIELNPNNGEALSYYALFLAFDGRVDEAMVAAGRRWRSTRSRRSST